MNQLLLVDNNQSTDQYSKTTPTAAVVN